MADSKETTASPVVKVGPREEHFQCKVFDVTSEQVSLADGRYFTCYTVQHPGAVVILPMLDQQTFLVVRQYRHAIGQEIIEFPAGTLESGEKPLACAQREIAEEVKHAASQWESLGVIYPAPGFCTELQHGFLARDLTPHDLAGDEDEIISIEKWTISNFEQGIDQGTVVDAKSIAFFLRARLRGFIA